MTIEIRQMVIKSSIDNGADKAGKKTASRKTADQDESNEDCGDGCGGPGGGGERQRMRAMLAEEFERMRER